MKLTYNLQTISQLYSLGAEQVENLVKTEGYCVIDSKTKQKVGYLPTLKVQFRVEEGQDEALYSNVNDSWFNISVDNTIFTIQSVSDIPVSAFLFSDKFREVIDDSRSRSSVLIPSLTGRTLFIAEDELIDRLSRGVSEDFMVVKAADLKGAKL